MPDSPFADKTVLVWDQGLYVHVAEKLAETFGCVYYFCEWRAAFPVPDRHRIGFGLDGIEVVKDPSVAIDVADLIVFPDVYYGNTAEFLRRRLGKRVWGSGYAESLELSRTGLKETLADLGMATGDYTPITGMKALRAYLKDHKDVYVKADVYRGACETFKHPKWWLSEQLLDEMQVELGPIAELMQFIIEKPIKGPEFGFDGSTVGGQFSNIVAWGYEDKDAGYAGQVCAYDELPEDAREINAKLVPLFDEMQVCSFLSWEARKTKDGTLYLLDPCMRAGSPPSEVYIENFENWDEHIYFGAEDRLVDLVPKKKFMAEIILKSARAKSRFLALEYPEEVAPYIKIHGHCRFDGHDYSAPLGIEEFGAAIGLGDSLEEAVKMASDNAGQVDGLDVRYEKNALSGAMDKIEEGEEYGIHWSA